MKKIILLLFVFALGLAVEDANADFTFGNPTNLGPTVNSSVEDGSPDISADGLTLYFDSYYRPGGLGRWDIWMTTQMEDGNWGTAVPLPPPVNSEFGDSGPCISADGLSLYFASDRPGTYGNYDIWVTNRPALNEPWGEPINLGQTVNSEAYDNHPSISADGLTLYFDSRRPGVSGGSDILVTTRATINEPWGEAVKLGPTINKSNPDLSPNISSDGLTLFYDVHILNRDIRMTRRGTPDDDWCTPLNLEPPVNTLYDDTDPSISVDGSMLYFASYRPGGVGKQDLWQVPIEPVVDLNGDGIVDSADMGIMVDHWGENYPLCDIGPMPWGDGIVDDQDQKVLSEYLLTYPGTLAYWKLDEAEGDIAYDSAGENDAIVFGAPFWQPEGGMVRGALEFDGIDDYISTSSFMWSSSGSSFSVFVWIKGGLPGQVIISQTDYADWLGADMTNGSLMTDLQFLGKSSRPLQSQTVITDGNWHRIGLVWDGSHRTLYVDDVEVAADKYDKGMLYGGLYIGAGKSLEPGTFWSGLIDDVHIYDRLITP
jgi:hypothetical protein